MRYPVDQRIVIPGHIPFGQPDPNAKHGFHAGDDSANPQGTQVYAPASGKVTYTGLSSSNQGLTVEIFDGRNYLHVFHLSSRSVSYGDQVTEGQPIGKVGSTGISTGSHLHFGVSRVPYLNTKSINDYIDPMEYIEGEPIMQPMIESTHEARVIALEYALDISGDDPFLARAVGQTELAYRTSLAGMVNNNVNNPNTGYKAQIAALEKQVADAGSNYVPVTEFYIKKGA